MTLTHAENPLTLHQLQLLPGDRWAGQRSGCAVDQYRMLTAGPGGFWAMVWVLASDV